MPTINQIRLPPPKDGYEFEDITLSAVRLRWANSEFQKNGSRKDRQNGVDIFGTDDLSRLICVQCRNLGAALTLAVVAKAAEEAEGFEKKIDAFYYATTRSKNSKLQLAVLKLSEERKNQGHFPIGVLFWEDIFDDLALDLRQVGKFYPWAVPGNALPLGESQKLRSLLEQDVWKARFRANQDLWSLARKLTTGLPSHPEMDWHEAGEMIALDLMHVEKDLQNFLAEYHSVLDDAVATHVTSACRAAHDGNAGVTFEEGEVIVQKIAVEAASKVHDELWAAAKASKEQILKVANA